MVRGAFAAFLLFTAASASAAPDPNLYLEQVDGARAMAKVKAWNAASRAQLEKQPGFASSRSRVTFSGSAGILRIAAN